MIKGSRHPGRFAVATGAIRWELCRGMVGVGRLIIVADMTAGTGIWRAVVIAVVAGGAIIGNSGMRAVQGIIIVVNSKACRLPTGRSMAGCAVRRNSECGMAGVGALVIVRRMTACAGIRRVGIVAVVAGIAVVGNACVRAGQRVNRAMVKR